MTIQQRALRSFAQTNKRAALTLSFRLIMQYAAAPRASYRFHKTAVATGFRCPAALFAIGAPGRIDTGLRQRAFGLRTHVRELFRRPRTAFRHPRLAHAVTVNQPQPSGLSCLIQKVPKVVVAVFVTGGVELRQ